VCVCVCVDGCVYTRTDLYFFLFKLHAVLVVGVSFIVHVNYIRPRVYICMYVCMFCMCARARVACIVWIKTNK